MKIDEIRENLQTKRLGKKILFLHEVSSTNDLAKQMADYGASEGTIVIAEKQTAGRGRLDRKWFSPKGGLYFSVIVRPKINAKEAVKLVFAAGLDVAEVLHENYGLKSETKWPNDVLVNGRKICGILSEMKAKGEKVDYVIIGIGVNANVDVEKDFPQELRSITTSIENELDKKVRLEKLLKTLIEKLDSIYEQFLNKGFTWVLEKWKKYAHFLGKTVKVSVGTESLCGLALDVDEEGALLIRLEDGTVKHVFVGDLSLKEKSSAKTSCRVTQDLAFGRT